MGFSCSSVSKASACNAGDLGLIPGSGRPPGEGNSSALQYSCLKNPMDRGAWEVTDYGVTSVGYKWVTKHTAHRYLKKQKDISLSLGQQRQTTIWQKPNTFVNPWWIRIANSTMLPRMSVEKYVKGMYVWKWETVLQAEGPESGKTRKEAEYYWGDSSAWEGNCRVELVK